MKCKPSKTRSMETWNNNAFHFFFYLNMHAPLKFHPSHFFISCNNKTSEDRSDSFTCNHFSMISNNVSVGLLQQGKDFILFLIIV